MRCVQWWAPGDVRVADDSRPGMADPRDAVVRVSVAAICGSDLHLYHNELRAMQRGDILGHEFVGVVEEVGPEVQNVRKGMRVAVSAIIADGTCDYCKMGMFSCCDTTNSSGLMEKLFGHRTAGLFGYSNLTGAYPGGQAQFVRVPYADVNCLALPPEIEDDMAIFLCDSLCTAWHANDIAHVGSVFHKNVAIWGAGPIGLLATACAKNRGAEKVIVIDSVPHRLELARSLGADDVINFREEDVLGAIKRFFPGGPDVCLECVGFRYTKSLLHKVEKTLMMETDSIDTVSEIVKAVRKGGTISLIGDFLGYTNHFPIGALMEKSITVVGGQVHVQKYWKLLLDKILKAELNPMAIVTHKLPLDKAPDAYAMFDSKTDDVVKVLLLPWQ
ncbi:glutathione-dependent formaldehyde dehydrogenase [Pelomyxa schiedti]|nr:glutathione-dependent formaldehyde dehydrogenase [Pelomyxa schiedti]